ncbi:hypothetical protein [Tropicimonas omnivorans]|uniref:hypothetical protein n=1 Tax=Tropicimonas omnivorans TaxID=3075590 RepID=UPI003D77FE59
MSSDFTGVTGGLALGNVVLDLVPDQEGAVAALGGDCEAIIFQDLDPGGAAPAVRIFQDVDRGATLVCSREWN